MARELDKRNETQQAIRAACIRQFGSKGFEGTGIRDIAREVGLTPAALYHYMGSKEDLLVGIMRDGTSKLLEDGKKALLNAGTSPIERLAALVSVHVRTHCEAQVEAQVSDYEIRSLSPGTRRGVVALRNRYEALWAEVLREGMEEGVFTVLNLSVCRLSLIQMCTGVANWYSDDGPLEVPELVDVFVDLALQMVGARRAGETNPDIVSPAIDDERGEEVRTA